MYTVPGSIPAQGNELVGFSSFLVLLASCILYLGRFRHRGMSLLEMAISSHPTPADAGVLCVILANTAISISIMREIVRSILHVIGIRIASWEELSVEPSDSAECHRSPSESYMEEFRSQIPTTRYDSISICDCLRQECSICLTEFKPNAEVNHLSCGHVFHKSCLEEWVNYWNTTCPLCRNYMIPQEVGEDACPM
ncbi:UNVERIFIED_CONTAM: putative E3 ubiquitin-protein ligase XERICO [Sesamum calycinum]|uniref:E3 ubiquitin-protein ligase XERICO n=1 Tax=Sesamum calycinum TaxID=2727403 RepID=A0AAW2MAK4_9LAMI